MHEFVYVCMYVEKQTNKHKNERLKLNICS